DELVSRLLLELGRHRDQDLLERARREHLDLGCIGTRGDENTAKQNRGREAKIAFHRSLPWAIRRRPDRAVIVIAISAPTRRERLTRSTICPTTPAMRPIHIIGGGLAGSEAAWQIAGRGIPVHLHEMRPVRGTAAHKTDSLAELVCSNSFRSD